MDDAELERRLFTPPSFEAKPARAQPDWNYVHKELKRRGVTLQLLWEEYRGEHVDGYGYSRFCDLYRDWLKTVSATMRQTHAAGEKLFVDWAGDTVPVFDAATGMERSRPHLRRGAGGVQLHLRRGPLERGAAGVDRRPRQRLHRHWRRTRRRGVRQPQGRRHRDLSLRARHQPHLPGSRHPLRHGDPAHPAEETARQGQGRGGRAHHRALRASALAQPALLLAVRAQCGNPGDRRRSQRPHHAQARRQPAASCWRRSSGQALEELPSEPYQYAEWKKCRVAPDYHVEVERHYYSVPSRLIREQVEARITDSTIEIFHKGGRVASHARSNVRNRHTTVREHMPSSHRRYAEWTPARMMREARKIGPATIALVQAVMKAKPHPEQGFRACLGILRLARGYGTARVEAACRRGNDIGATTYGSIASILKNGLDKAYAREPTPETPPIRHGNIRGNGYYH